jgi:hypothetical protein
MPERVMVFVDGPDADNQACAWGALNGFDTEHTELAGVVVSATAVNTAENAPLGSRNIEESRAVHQLHTARMAGLFARAGVDVPVFSGLDIEDTAITSPIPHRAHVSHEDYDIYGDATGQGRHAIAGDFNDALRYMGRLDSICTWLWAGLLVKSLNYWNNPLFTISLGIWLHRRGSHYLNVRFIASLLLTLMWICTQPCRLLCSILKI